MHCSATRASQYLRIFFTIIEDVFNIFHCARCTATSAAQNMRICFKIINLGDIVILNPNPNPKYTITQQL